ncbi:MAG: porphobilinogen synthase [Myxococcales bacterium]|nr:MAG: porphobilinogen synthase [Myxococcales bacterium]
MSDLVFRPRRLRRNESIRALVRETEVKASQLILPLFVVPGSGIKKEIASLPGVFHLSADRAVDAAKQAADKGLGGIILFGIPERKDAEGSSAWDPKGPVAQSIVAIKKAVPHLVVITDVCMCEYTNHGHCGVLEKDRNGELQVNNDATLTLLQKEALCHAEAGADIVAPSDMMDGRIGSIRATLDNKGFDQVAILSYAIKYASAFYGPFRDAAQSAPSEGDRRGYQMDPANRREAMRELMLDIEQGADMVMVKPALPYLDIVSDVRDAVDVPVVAYQVSGEYAMIKHAAAAGALDEEAAMRESLTAIKRAGADLIITYFANYF